MDQTFMKEKPILPLLLSMAAPMILSMLVNSLYNIIDSIFVAQISEDAMTALSLVFPIQNFVNSVAVGFGIGINVMIAFCLGAGDQLHAHKAASQGFFLSIVHGILLSITGILIMPSFLKLFTHNENILSLGLRYSNIVLLFSIIIHAEITFEKYFQAMGMMVVSMLSMLCGCILNIILDPILIFGLGPFPRLGIEGAAIATGIGQCSTLLIYLLFYIIKKPPVKIHRNLIRPEKKICARLYGVGIPAALNMALPSLLISALNAILASISETGVTILGIYYKLQTFLYLSVNGMIQGMRPIIGYNYGAKEYGRVKKAIVFVSAVSVLYTLGVWSLVHAFPEFFIRIFNRTGDLVEAGIPAMRIYFFGFFMMAFQFAGQAIFVGLGKAKNAVFFSIFRKVIIVIPLIIILPSMFHMGTDGILMAEPVSNFIGGTACFVTMLCTVWPELTKGERDKNK